MIRRPPRSTQSRSSAASDVYKRQYVIRNKATFLKAGLIPDSVPDFPFGYALGQQIFVMEQDSLYYTRHLLLHESVHALMFKHFGGAGPSWFMEGSAEMLSVHRLTGSDTQINQPPADRSSVPYWGRYKLMSERRKASGIPSLNSVIEYPRCLLYTSPSPRDRTRSRMPSSA